MHPEMGTHLGWKEHHNTRSNPDREENELLGLHSIRKTELDAERRHLLSNDMLSKQI